MGDNPDLIQILDQTLSMRYTKDKMKISDIGFWKLLGFPRRVPYWRAIASNNKKAHRSLIWYG